VPWEARGVVVHGGLNVARDKAPIPPRALSATALQRCSAATLQSAARAQFFSDLWVLEAPAGGAPARWREPAREGPAPRERNSHAAALIEDGPRRGQMVRRGPPPPFVLIGHAASLTPY